MRILSDNEIAGLIAEGKHMPARWQSQLRRRKKSSLAHDEREFEVVGEQGHNFRLLIRRSKVNLLDFSAILFFEESGERYRLLRYNGKHSSRHTNLWEQRRGQPGARFDPTFHIHRATERYQSESGLEIDGHAEPTTRYSDCDTAVTALLQDCAFEVNDGSKPRLL